MSRIALECRLLKCVGVSGARISSADPTAQLHRIFTICVCPAWVPAGMSSIKIAEEKGFVAMDENCVEIRSLMEPCGGL
ncbi:hypothetical protein TNCV_1725471 [Trichonephila clavipes]|nr:hypothetical protein TNCV_1725471 [Trichonephila clavipes]